MKRNGLMSLLAVFFTIVILSIAGCDQNPSTEKSSVPDNDLSDQYVLMENCGNRSEAWFKSHQQNYPGDKLIFTNHYNTRLNTCFIYITSFQSGGYQTLNLTNVYEDRKYGSCVGVVGQEDDYSCDFLDQDVKGKKEWDSLVKPYMED